MFLFRLAGAVVDTQEVDPVLGLLVLPLAALGVVSRGPLALRYVHSDCLQANNSSYKTRALISVEAELAGR